ncbi:hypothetical protein KIPB_000793, partial [Kipferlia bialata]|eukprot:g793.t1
MSGDLVLDGQAWFNIILGGLLMAAASGTVMTVPETKDPTGLSLDDVTKAYKGVRDSFPAGLILPAACAHTLVPALHTLLTILAPFFHTGIDSVAAELCVPGVFQDLFPSLPGDLFTLLSKGEAVEATNTVKSGTDTTWDFGTIGGTAAPYDHSAYFPVTGPGNAMRGPLSGNIVVPTNIGSLGAMCPTSPSPSLSDVLTRVVDSEYMPDILYPQLKETLTLCLDMVRIAAAKGMGQCVAAFMPAVRFPSLKSAMPNTHHTLADIAIVLDGYREMLGEVMPHLVEGLTVCTGSDMATYLDCIGTVLVEAVAADWLYAQWVPKVVVAVRQRLSSADLSADWTGIRSPLSSLLERHWDAVSGHLADPMTSTYPRTTSDSLGDVPPGVSPGQVYADRTVLHCGLDLFHSQVLHSQLQGVDMLSELVHLSDCALTVSALVPHLAVVPKAVMSEQTNSRVVRSCTRLCVYLTVKGGLPSDFYTSLVREACRAATRGERGEVLLELVSHCIPDLPASVLDSILSCIETHYLVQYKGVGTALASLLTHWICVPCDCVPSGVCTSCHALRTIIDMVCRRGGLVSNHTAVVEALTASVPSLADIEACQGVFRSQLSLMHHLLNRFEAGTSVHNACPRSLPSVCLALLQRVPSVSTTHTECISTGDHVLALMEVLEWYTNMCVQDTGVSSAQRRRLGALLQSGTYGASPLDIVGSTSGSIFDGPNCIFNPSGFGTVGVSQVGESTLDGTKSIRTYLKESMAVVGSLANSTGGEGEIPPHIASVISQIGHLNATLCKGRGMKGLCDGAYEAMVGMPDTLFRSCSGGIWRLWNTVVDARAAAEDRVDTSATPSNMIPNGPVTGGPVAQVYTRIFNLCADDAMAHEAADRLVIELHRSPTGPLCVPNTPINGHVQRLFGETSALLNTDPALVSRRLHLLNILGLALLNGHAAHSRHIPIGYSSWNVAADKVTLHFHPVSQNPAPNDVFVVSREASMWCVIQYVAAARSVSEECMVLRVGNRYISDLSVSVSSLFPKGPADKVVHTQIIAETSKVPLSRLCALHSLHATLMAGIEGHTGWTEASQQLALTLLNTLPTDPVLVESVRVFTNAIMRDTQAETLTSILSSDRVVPLQYSLEHLQSYSDTWRLVDRDTRLKSVVLESGIRALGVLTMGSEIEGERMGDCVAAKSRRKLVEVLASFLGEELIELYENIQPPRSYLADTGLSPQLVEKYSLNNTGNSRHIGQLSFGEGDEVTAVHVCLKSIAHYAQTDETKYQLQDLGLLLTLALLSAADPITALLDPTSLCRPALAECLSLDRACTVVNTALLTCLSRTHLGQEDTCSRAIEMLLTWLSDASLSPALRLGVTALLRVVDSVLGEQLGATEPTPMMHYAYTRLGHQGPTQECSLPRVDDTLKYTHFVSTSRATESYTELVLLLDVFWSSDAKPTKALEHALLHNLVFSDGVPAAQTYSAALMSIVELRGMYRRHPNRVARRLQEVIHTSKSALRDLSGYVAPYEWVPKDHLSLEEDVDTSLPTGLYNLGNSCFANAVLQLLFSVPAFREGILSIDPSTLDHLDPMESDLPSSEGILSIDPSPLESDSPSFDTDHLLALYRLFTQLEAGLFPALSTAEFFKHMHIPGIVPTQQQDASEFLSALLSSVSEACKAHNLRDVVTEVFGGTS